MALPLAAAAIGLLAPRSRVASALVLAAPAAALASAIALTRARNRVARAERPAGGSTGQLPRPEDLPRISVLIPANNEAAVIGALIADLGSQDYRDADDALRFEVVVIDDRSTDGTADVAAAALEAAKLQSASQIVRRDSAASPGKGAALADVPLSTLRGEAVLVLDADARLEPGFLRRAATLLANNAAVQPRRRMLRPERGGLPQLLAAVQDDEQTIDGAIQAGRWSLGAGSEFRGDGSTIHLRALQAAGGWDAGALCEDLELSSRLLAVQGDSVAWDPALEVWEQPVVDLGALVRQRLRWAEGLVRRELRVTPAVLRSRCLSTRQRAIIAAYSAQSLAPVAMLGLIAHARSPRARWLLLASAGGYVVSAATLGVAVLGAEGTADAQSPRTARLVRAMAVVCFSAAWVALLPVAWFRVALDGGRPHFANTRHAEGFSPPPSIARPAGRD